MWGCLPSCAGLKETGRVRFEAATDREVIEALSLTIQKEGVIPALESAHAFVQAFKEAPELSPEESIIINQSGRGDKDIFTVADAFDDPGWKDFINRKRRNTMLETYIRKSVEREKDSAHDPYRSGISVL